MADIKDLKDTPRNRTKAANVVMFGPMAAASAPPKLIRAAREAFCKLSPADIAAIGELEMWAETH